MYGVQSAIEYLERVLRDEYEVYVFNQDLNAWNVSNVANMEGLFANCTAFNQPLNGWTPIKVTNMAYMFSSCTTFNLPIGSWNVSKVG